MSIESAVVLRLFYLCNQNLILKFKSFESFGDSLNKILYLVLWVVLAIKSKVIILKYITGYTYSILNIL